VQGWDSAKDRDVAWYGGGGTPPLRLVFRKKIRLWSEVEKKALIRLAERCRWAFERDKKINSLKGTRSDCLERAKGIDIPLFHVVPVGSSS